jgi:hypothetical protein
MSPTTNAFNSMYNAVVNEVRDAISASNLMTPELDTILNNLQKTGVKNSTTAKKPKQRRFTGYLLFVSEHAKVVRAEQPELKPKEVTGVVAKAWKSHLDDAGRESYNARARANKMAYDNGLSASETDTGETISSEPASEPIEAVTDASTSAVKPPVKAKRTAKKQTPKKSATASKSKGKEAIVSDESDGDAHTTTIPSHLMDSDDDE